MPNCETQVPPQQPGELTPLLHNESPVPPEGDELILVATDEVSVAQASFWQESGQILNLAWPGSVTAFFSFSTAIVNTAMVQYLLAYSHRNGV